MPHSRAPHHSETSEYPPPPPPLSFFPPFFLSVSVSFFWGVRCEWVKMTTLKITTSFALSLGWKRVGVSLFGGDAWGCSAGRGRGGVSLFPHQNRHQHRRGYLMLRTVLNPRSVSLFSFFFTTRQTLRTLFFVLFRLFVRFQMMNNISLLPSSLRRNFLEESNPLVERMLWTRICF